MGRLITVVSQGLPAIIMLKPLSKVFLLAVAVFQTTKYVSSFINTTQTSYLAFTQNDILHDFMEKACDKFT